MVRTNTQSLRSSAEKSRNSLESLSELLQYAEEMRKTGKANPDEFAKIQRKVLLDSFTVKKFHRDYKEWEHSQKDQFLEQEVKPYNRKYAEMSRIYGDLEQSEAVYEEVRKSTKIPAFDFSIQTIQQFENGILLDRVARNADGSYPTKVPVSSLFSLDSGILPTPSFPVFNRLVNLEYRLRMLLQIKHEVLLRAKAHLAAKNSQWASRDTTLNQFLTRDFAAVHSEITRIKASEYEDLKYYEEDFDDEKEDKGEDGEYDEKEDKEEEEYDEKDDMDDIDSDRESEKEEREEIEREDGNDEKSQEPEDIVTDHEAQEYGGVDSEVQAHSAATDESSELLKTLSKEGLEEDVELQNGHGKDASNSHNTGDAREEMELD